MALVPVSGTFRDVSGGIDPAEHLRLVFQLNGAAIGASGIVHASPHYVDEFTGPAGEWSTEIEATETLWRTTGGDVFYRVSIERTVRGAAGFPTDLPGWTLRVPPGGGEFARLVKAPANPSQNWIGPEPPADPSQWTGWINTQALPGEPNYFKFKES